MVNEHGDGAGLLRGEDDVLSTEEAVPEIVTDGAASRDDVELAGGSSIDGEPSIPSVGVVVARERNLGSGGHPCDVPAEGVFGVREGVHIHIDFTPGFSDEGDHLPCVGALE